MWAAILSEKPLTIKRIAEELSTRGWKVISNEIREFEAIPPNVTIWATFDYNNVKQTQFTCQGFVQVYTDKDVEQTEFIVVNSKWWIRWYYEITMSLYMLWYRLKLTFFLPDEKE